MADAVPIVIRRCARARLYHAGAGRYVSPEDLPDGAARGVAFTVVDVETGEEVTAVLLA